MIPTEVIARLICVLSCLVNDDIPQIHQVIENGQVNYITLQHVQAILTQTRRDDVVEIVRQTMAGDNTLLEWHETKIEGTLNEFYNDRNHAAREWPAWCYRITQNNNPVRQEMSEVSGRTENDNILVSETGGGAQNNERDRDVEARSRHQDLPRPSAPRRPETRRPQADQRKSPWPRFLQSPSTEPVFPQPLFPLQNPPPSQCCICGKYIQVTQTSRPVWSRIRDMITELNPENLRSFITEINKYDSRILNFVQFHASSSQEVIDAIIVPSLQRCHLSGRKCVLCLLSYLFQRIGLSDLANQVKRI